PFVKSSVVKKTSTCKVVKKNCHTWVSLVMVLYEVCASWEGGNTSAAGTVKDGGRWGLRVPPAQQTNEVNTPWPAPVYHPLVPYWNSPAAATSTPRPSAAGRG
uniref:Uncharacterized protein n=1 Tax=Labrus bergylta TaxID=56723 RepID=A0A3Q3G6C4_9LABR